MKGVPIKFRGKRADGEYVYGDLIHRFTDDGENFTTATRLTNEVVAYYVDEDTVAQLVGYDAAGNELYEGDEVNIYHSFQASAANLAKSKKYETGKVGLTATVNWAFAREDLDSDDYQVLMKCD